MDKPRDCALSLTNEYIEKYLSKIHSLSQVIRDDSVDGFLKQVYAIELDVTKQATKSMMDIKNNILLSRAMEV